MVIKRKTNKKRDRRNGKIEIVRKRRVVGGGKGETEAS